MRGWKLYAPMALFGLAAFVSVAQAATTPVRPTIEWGAGPYDKKHKGPPQEAFAACEGKGEGQVTQLTNPRGDKVDAVCLPREGKMVAVRMLPQEALDACQGKKVDDQVEFTVPQRNRTVKAVCQEKDGKLVAVPVKNYKQKKKEDVQPKA